MCMSGSVTLTPPRQSSSPVATAKRLYRDAARAFLVRDFALASRALAHAREALTSSSSITGHEWLELVRDSNTQQQQQRKEDVTVELWRKLAILRITLTATVLADEQQHVSSSANLHEDVSRLAALGPQQAVVALWLDAAHGSGIAVGSSAARDEIVADEQCALVHPTIAIALALAAVKLGELRLAARVAEAWLGAIDPAVEQALVRRTTASAQTEERLGASDMLASSAASLDPNSISLSNSEDSTAKPGGSTATSIVKAWYRLHDIYALHVLPRLGEWDAAVDFVKLQGVENGGWVSQARVTGTLKQLDEVKHQLAAEEQARAEAIAAAETARHQRSRDAATPPSSSAPGKRPSASPTSSSSRGSSSSSGNGKAREAHDVAKSKSKRRHHSKRNNGQANGTGSQAPAAARRDEAVAPRQSDFAQLRQSLAAYIQRGRSAADGAVAPPPPSPYQVLRDMITSRVDPTRAVTMVCLALVISSLVRRRLQARRARGERGLGVTDAFVGAFVKVFQTAKAVATL